MSTWSLTGDSARPCHRVAIPRPMASDAQVEQDLVLSRALDEIEDRQNGIPNWYLQWRPQGDENPNGIPAEFAIALGRSSPPVKRGRKHSAGSGRKRSMG